MPECLTGNVALLVDACNEPDTVISVRPQRILAV